MEMMEMNDPKSIFRAIIIYRDKTLINRWQHIYETADMGDALSYAEHIFHCGYATIRNGNTYTFIPLSRILEIEVC